MNRKQMLPCENKVIQAVVQPTELVEEFVELFKSSIDADCRAHTVRQQEKLGQALKNDSIRFKGFIAKIGSNEKFCSFLGQVKDTYADNELSQFIKDYLFVLSPYTVSYRRFYRWINYTISSRRHLIQSAFYQFYGNLCKTPSHSKVTNGIIAKHLKSSRKKKEDVGTINEYRHEIIVKTTNTQIEIDEIVTYHKKLMQKDLSISPDEVKHLGILQTYAFKFGFGTDFSAWKNKRIVKAQVRTRSKRIDKYKEGTKTIHFDYAQVNNYLRKNLGVWLLMEYEGNSNKMNAGMSLMGRQLRTMYWKTWYQDMISNKKPEIVKNKARLFVEDFRKKAKTNKSLMGGKNEM